ncbi:MAG: hypothetical protein HYU57_06760 [Micavibrio aeruginosavorus]|nr:hypothetical protein [Micavibrio aeruginosavorus]
MALVAAIAAYIDAIADADEGVADSTLQQEDQERVSAFLTVALLSLPPVQRKVLQGLYGVDENPKTVPQLAAAFRMSAEEVTEHHDQALFRLRRFFCENRPAPRADLRAP